VEVELVEEDQLLTLHQELQILVAVVVVKD
jgi:hypothetical protein